MILSMIIKNNNDIRVTKKNYNSYGNGKEQLMAEKNLYR